MTDWTEKYRPTTLGQVTGNDTAVADLEEWADSWPEHREAVILYGPPGIGKTSAAHALASDRGWDAMEMNASDERTGDIVDRIAGEASKSGTLTAAGAGGRRLVIIDEADNFDRGGSRAITDVAKEANQPIVLIANEFYDMSDGLRNAAQSIEFDGVSVSDIVPALEFICSQEGVSAEQEALKRIAEQADGDVRSAVNDLQAVATSTDEIAVDDIATATRDKEEGLFDFLDEVLMEGRPDEMPALSRQVDETPDDLLMWIEQNVPKPYSPTELEAAYERLSRADQWLGRVYATQEYTYWRYASTNMTAGVAASRSGSKDGWHRFGPPYGRYYGGGSKHREEAARRIADHADVSLATAKREILPLLAEMIEYCKPRELTVSVAARYDLNEKQVAALTGSGASTNKVEGIVEDAQEQRRKLDLGSDESEGIGDGDVTGNGEIGRDDADDSDGEADSESDTSDADDADDTEEPDEVEDEDEDGDEDDGGTAQSGLGDFV